MSFNDIKSMPISQRVQLMETLWESLRTEEVEPKSPTWHKDILDARIKKLKEGNIKTYTLDELKTRR